MSHWERWCSILLILRTRPSRIWVTIIPLRANGSASAILRRNSAPALAGDELKKLIQTELSTKIRCGSPGWLFDLPARCQFRGSAKCLCGFPSEPEGFIHNLPLGLETRRRTIPRLRVRLHLPNETARSSKINYPAEMQDLNRCLNAQAELCLSSRFGR